MAGEDGAFILKHYSLGVQRLPLFSTAPHPVNRDGAPLSGKHLHAQGRRILFEQGFYKYLYEAGLVIQQDPENPRLVYEHYRVMSGRDALLAPAQTSMVHGACGKTHLSGWLQALACGLNWDHDGSKMVVPDDEKHDELRQVVQ